MLARTLGLSLTAAAALAVTVASPATAGTPATPLANATGGVSGSAQVRFATRPGVDGACQHSGIVSLTAPLTAGADLGVWYSDAAGGLHLIGDGENVNNRVRILLDRGHTPDATGPWEVRSVTETRDRAAGTRTFTPGSVVYGSFNFTGAPVTGCTTD